MFLTWPGAIPPGDHPSEEHLAEYRDGQMSEETARPISAHVEHCAQCRQVLDGYAAMLGLLDMLPQYPVPRSFAVDDISVWRKTRPIWPAYASLAASIVFALAMLGSILVSVASGLNGASMAGSGASSGSSRFGGQVETVTSGGPAAQEPRAGATAASGGATGAEVVPATGQASGAASTRPAPRSERGDASAGASKQETSAPKSAAPAAATAPGGNSAKATRGRRATGALQPGFTRLPPTQPSAASEGPEAAATAAKAPAGRSAPTATPTEAVSTPAPTAASATTDLGITMTPTLAAGGATQGETAAGKPSRQGGQASRGGAEVTSVQPSSGGAGGAGPLPVFLGAAALLCFVLAIVLFVWRLGY